MSSVSDKFGFRCVPAAIAGRAALLAAVIWVLLAAGRADAEAAESAEPSAGRRTEIVFRGNTAKKEADLRKAAAEELADFEQKGQRTFDADDAAYQMERAYRQSGFAFARVDYEVRHAAAKTTLVFTIDEGPRVLVREILLTRNKAVASEELIPFFGDGKTGLFAPGETPFVQSDIEGALTAIRDFYRSRGFMDVAVEKPRYVFAEDRKQVDIHVDIREGVRYEVHEVKVQGDVPVEAHDGLEALRRETIGQVYTGRTALAVRARLLEIYGDLGYADAVVEVSKREEAETGRVGLDATVMQGPRITVDQVRVLGNLRTREDFIRRRLKLRPGDRYSLALEKESFQALYKSGLFSKVTIDLEKTGDEGRRVLRVTVEEAPSLEVYLEPGYGSYEELRLKTGVRQKNLFGTGRNWNAEVLGALKAQRFTTGFTDPWFLDYDLRADLTGFAGRREEPSFTRRDLGTAFSLTKELFPRLTGSTVATFRRTDLSATNVAIDEEDVRDDYDYSSLKAQLTYDTRNDVFFPASGQRSFGAVEHADTWLGGNVTLTRLTGGSRFFFQLSPSTVAGFRYSTGLIIPGEAEFTVPLAERFFNGGENTVRSFKESELGPKDSSNDPAGGLAYNVLSVELRQRLIGNFTGTLFADFGNVSPNRTREDEGKPPYRNRSQIISDTLGDFFRGFRPGVGFGLQYLLPVGPARLDIAFNPDRDSERDEDRYAVHFSVGMAF